MSHINTEDEFISNIFLEMEKMEEEKNKKSDSKDEPDGAVESTDYKSEIKTDISDQQEWRYFGSDDNHHQNDPSRVQWKKHEDKNIFKETEKFPEIIKKEANKKYQELTNGKILRAESRLGLIFACVYYTYAEMGIPCDPKAMIKDMNGILKKSISKGNREYVIRMGMIGKRILIKNHIKPKNYIDIIMDNFQSNKTNKQRVKEICEAIEPCSGLLNSSKPESIACAVVYYYLKYTKQEIKCSTFAKIVNLSEITIQKLAKEIKIQLSDTKTKL